MRIRRYQLKVANSKMPTGEFEDTNWKIPTEGYELKDTN